MNSRALVFMLSIYLLAGCKHSQSVDTQPALLIDTSPEVKAIIQAAIVTLKGGVAPQLADNVFINRSTLLLERGMNTSGHDPILGMHDLSVTRFELQMRHGQCVLYYPKKEAYLNLDGVECVAVEATAQK
ncbi:hypothetical protein PSECIP111854_03501 [Pseudoalteromonas sp. CIP111854]|uniref:Lipoprotein n=1 Tax=Pseudoalteromonas holothuriae TaxID=2963714 RepID=A0A9W4R3C8_9GAMM|nr:hypothetical protein [Pseudoalteromonas sp. CIP111854]CAH9064639.1 hypothetical protein PSECIP111854_03501 [Pseudoalteromonas sp. CIP111854]